MCDFLLPPQVSENFLDGSGRNQKLKSEIHPLELKLRELKKNQASHQFSSVSAAFGIGFARELEAEYEIIKATEITYTENKKPNTLASDIFTGNIDRIDFCDKFTPNGYRSDVHYDIHEINEKRFGLD